MAYAKVRVDEAATVVNRKPSSGQKEQWSLMLDKIFEWSVVGLVFLMPIFFLPLTTEPLELNKQMLLFVGTLWLGLLYTTKIVVSGSVSLKRSPVFWGMLAMLGAWILSTVFSLYPYNSILGIDGQEFVSLGTIVSLFVVTFILAQSGTSRLASRVVTSLLASTTLVSLIGLLQLFNVALFPWDFTKANSFNTVGVYTLWGVLAVAGLVLAINEIVRVSLVDSNKKTAITVALALFTALHLLLLIIFNDFSLWLALVVGLIISLVFLYTKLPENKKVSWLILPCFMVIFSITMMGVTMMGLTIPRLVTLPIVANPSFKTSASITMETLKNSPAFGYGPGNFITSYTKFRPKEMNNVALFDLWTARFDQSSSYVLTKIAETGAVGVVAMLLLVVLLLLQIVKFLKDHRLDDETLTFLGISSALGAMLVTTVLKPSDITITFVWWILIALVLVFTTTQGKAMSGSQSNRFVILSSLALYTLVALGFVGIFFAGNRYGADLTFADAIRADRQLSAELAKAGKTAAPEQIDGLIQQVVRAIQIDPRNDIYPRSLSQVLMSKLSGLLASAKTQQDVTAALQTLPAQAAGVANNAVALNKYDVRNLLNVASVSQTLLPFATDAEKLSADNYAKALQLDPTNPAVSFAYARLYLDKAALSKQRSQNEKATDEEKQKAQADLAQALTDAEKYLNQTLDLKKDFAPAYFYLATIRAEQGKKDEALKLLDMAATTNAQLAQFRSADENLFYLTGLAYASLEEKDRASDSFRAAFTLRPNYELALWNYSLLQADKGNKDEAIRALQQILQYDKNNTTVQDKLKELNGEAPAAAPASDTTK